MNGVTFDTGDLVALDRNDRRVIALLERARELGARVTLPATQVGLLLACLPNALGIHRLHGAGLRTS